MPNGTITALHSPVERTGFPTSLKQMLNGVADSSNRPHLFVVRIVSDAVAIATTLRQHQCMRYGAAAMTETVG